MVPASSALGSWQIGTMRGRKDIAVWSPEASELELASQEETPDR
jgi:hypothetical protein